MVNYVTKKQVNMHDLRVRSFGVIWSRISDPRSLRSWYIKGTDESTLVTDLSVSFMHHDPSDLGSLILRDRSFFMREGGLVGFGKHYLKIT